MQESKASQRSLIILQLGKLIAPIEDLASRAVPPSTAEYRLLGAAIELDIDKWNAEVNKFATIGGVRLGQEANDIMRPIVNLCRGSLSDLVRSRSTPLAMQENLRSLLRQAQLESLEAIENVPVDWEPRLLAEKTPFSVYMHIRDAINSAKRRVHYCDRYLNVEFFHLYLGDLSRALQIRLVTTSGDARFGVANVRPVSAVAAAEFADYQLVECQPTDLHDRNLRVDDQIFFLGPSINAAGKHPTNFAPTDSSLAAHTILDNMIAKGAVVS